MNAKRLLLAVACGWCSMAFVCNPAPPPPPPAPVHYLTFNWTYPGSGMFFNIYCGSISGQEESMPLNRTPIVGNTFLYSNAPSRAYYCRVQAISGTSKGPMSNEQGVVVP